MHAADPSQMPADDILGNPPQGDAGTVGCSRRQAGASGSAHRGAAAADEVASSGPGASPGSAAATDPIARPAPPKPVPPTATAPVAIRPLLRSWALAVGAAAVVLLIALLMTQSRPTAAGCVGSGRRA